MKKLPLIRPPRRRAPWPRTPRHQKPQAPPPRQRTLRVPRTLPSTCNTFAGISSSLEEEDPSSDETNLETAWICEVKAISEASTSNCSGTLPAASVTSAELVNCTGLVCCTYLVLHLQNILAESGAAASAFVSTLHSQSLSKSLSSEECSPRSISSSLNLT